MNNRFILAVLLVLALPSWAAPTKKAAAPQAAVVTTANTDTSEVPLRGKNALALELLGRGFLYGLSFDHMISDQVALGFGYSSWGTNTSSVKSSINVLPVYANFYSSPKSHRGFLSAGADYVAVTWDWRDSVESVDGVNGFGIRLNENKASATVVVPVLAAGYEYRGLGGFLFRGTVYEIFGQEKALTWLGLGFGYAF